MTSIVLLNPCVSSSIAKQWTKNCREQLLWAYRTPIFWASYLNLAWFLKDMAVVRYSHLLVKHPWLLHFPSNIRSFDKAVWRIFWRSFVCLFVCLFICSLYLFYINSDPYSIINWTSYIKIVIQLQLIRLNTPNTSNFCSNSILSEYTFTMRWHTCIYWWLNLETFFSFFLECTIFVNVCWCEVSSQSLCNLTGDF